MTVNDSGSEPIIHTKIVRPAVRSVVHRARLYERLDNGATLKLTVVSAPAGYGKTTLVSSWLNQRSLDHCWLTLDRFDVSALRVATYLAAALDRLDQRAILPGANRWVAILNRLEERSRDTIVILDDYHLAESVEVNDLVMQLVEHLPPSAHLMIITRTDPALRLSKLRGQGEVIEIRERDLAFTREESEAFFSEVAGITLTAADTQALSRTTEGWVAGLQILATSLKDSSEPVRYVRELTGRNRYLRDYIVEEVIARLEPQTLGFLEQCSILERLSAELCDAVTGRTDSRELLDAVERQNLFVSPLDEQRRWYRMHHLFAQVLSARLLDQPARRLADLHVRASKWFEANGYPLEAITHRVASGDATGSAELIDRYGEWLVKHGELMTAKRWIGSLPDDVCARYPLIVLLRAWGGILDGRPLEEIERDLDSISTGVYEADVLVLRSYIEGLQGRDDEAVRLATLASRLVGEPDSFISAQAKFRAAVARLGSGQVDEAIERLESAASESLESGNLLVAATALVHKAGAIVLRGELDDGEHTYQRVLDLSASGSGGRGWFAGWALIGLGEISRMRGNIAEAIGLFREGMQMSLHWLELNDFYGGFGLAHALVAQGKHREALETLQAADHLSRRFAIPFYFTRLARAHRTLVLMRCGRFEEARAVFRGELSIDAPPSAKSYVEALVSNIEVSVRARFALLDGELAKCIELALPAARQAWEQRRCVNALDAELILTRAYWQADRFDDALSALKRALSIAERGGIVQPFIDEGPELARILYRARTLDAKHAFAGRLLAAFPLDQQGSAAAEGQPRTLDSLNAREVEVLTLLARGLSNKEVAARLNLSVRTVRWHASNLYAKLNVSSRTQAIAKARQLEILPE